MYTEEEKIMPEDVTNSKLLEVLKEMKYDISQLTKKINCLEFTILETLRMCQDAFVKVELAVVACSTGYERCAKGYEACKEGFEEVHDLVEDFPDRIDCGVATGYL